MREKVIPTYRMHRQNSPATYVEQLLREIDQLSKHPSYEAIPGDLSDCVVELRRLLLERGRVANTPDSPEPSLDSVVVLRYDPILDDYKDALIDYASFMAASSERQVSILLHESVHVRQLHRGEKALAERQFLKWKEVLVESGGRTWLAALRAFSHPRYGGNNQRLFEEAFRGVLDLEKRALLEEYTFLCKLAGRPTRGNFGDDVLDLLIRLRTGGIVTPSGISQRQLTMETIGSYIRLKRPLLHDSMLVHEMTRGGAVPVGTDGAGGLRAVALKGADYLEWVLPRT